MNRKAVGGSRVEDTKGGFKGRRREETEMFIWKMNRRGYHKEKY
jgi:hypothetical protein